MSTTQLFYFVEFDWRVFFKGSHHNIRYPLGGYEYHEDDLQPYSHLGDAPGQGLFDLFPQGFLGDKDVTDGAVHCPIEP